MYCFNNNKARRNDVENDILFNNPYNELYYVYTIQSIQSMILNDYNILDSEKENIYFNEVIMSFVSNGRRGKKEKERVAREMERERWGR